MEAKPGRMIVIIIKFGLFGGIYSHYCEFDKIIIRQNPCQTFILGPEL